METLKSLEKAFQKEVAKRDKAIANIQRLDSRVSKLESRLLRMQNIAKLNATIKAIEALLETPAILSNLVPLNIEYSVHDLTDKLFSVKAMLKNISCIIADDRKEDPEYSKQRRLYTARKEACWIDGVPIARVNL
jgi:hypothetical protein